MKTIISTNKYEILVDDEDYETLNKYRWYSYKSNKGKISIGRIEIINRKRSLIMLNKYIMTKIIGIDIPKNKRIYYKDKNPLNNQKYNLDIDTVTNINLNRKPSKRNISGVVGVVPINNGWRANLSINKEVLLNKTFKNKDDAIKARKEAETKYGISK